MQLCIEEYNTRIEIESLLSDALKEEQDYLDIVKQILIRIKNYQVLNIFNNLVEQNKIRVVLASENTMIRLLKLFKYKYLGHQGPLTMAYYNMQTNDITIFLDYYYIKDKKLDISKESEEILIYTFVHEYIHYYAHNYPKKFIAYFGNYLKSFYDEFISELDPTYLIMRKNFNYVKLFNLEQKLLSYLSKPGLLLNQLYELYFKPDVTDDEIAKIKEFIPGAYALYKLIKSGLNIMQYKDSKYFSALQYAILNAYKNGLRIKPPLISSYYYQEIIFPSEVICMLAASKNYQSKILSKIIK